MLKKDIILTNRDIAALSTLDFFLPERIFDAHAHVFSSSHLPSTHRYGEENVADLEIYFLNMTPLLLNPRELRVNLITYPDSSMADISSGNLDRADEFLIEQLNKSDSNVGEIMVVPGESVYDIEKRLSHPRIRGLKCYFNMSKRQEHGDESPEEYLPESAWLVADKHRLAITLHLGKERALSAPENLSYIKCMAEKYRNAKLILAHSARAFSARTAIDSVENLRKYENVWFDFSAICESPSIMKIIKTVGVGRCMWGSDYPTNTFLGKAISYADKFAWLDGTVLDGAWNLGVENLMAMKEAADILELSRADVEDIFYNNAVRLFN